MWIYLSEHQLLKALTLSLLISQTRESDIFTIHLISLLLFGSLMYHNLPEVDIITYFYFLTLSQGFEASR